MNAAPPPPPPPPPPPSDEQPTSSSSPQQPPQQKQFPAYVNVAAANTAFSYASNDHASTNASATNRTKQPPQHQPHQPPLSSQTVPVRSRMNFVDAGAMEAGDMSQTVPVSRVHEFSPRMPTKRLASNSRKKRALSPQSRLPPPPSSPPPPKSPGHARSRTHGFIPASPEVPGLKSARAVGGPLVHQREPNGAPPSSRRMNNAANRSLSPTKWRPYSHQVANTAPYVASKALSPLQTGVLASPAAPWNSSQGVSSRKALPTLPQGSAFPNTARRIPPTHAQVLSRTSAMPRAPAWQADMLDKLNSQTPRFSSRVTLSRIGTNFSTRSRSSSDQSPTTSPDRSQRPSLASTISPVPTRVRSHSDTDVDLGGSICSQPSFAPPRIPYQLHRQPSQRLTRADFFSRPSYVIPAKNVESARADENEKFSPSLGPMHMREPSVSMSFRYSLSVSRCDQDPSSTELDSLPRQFVGTSPPPSLHRHLPPPPKSDKRKSLAIFAPFTRPSSAAAGAAKLPPRPPVRKATNSRHMRHQTSPHLPAAAFAKTTQRTPVHLLKREPTLLTVHDFLRERPSSALRRASSAEDVTMPFRRSVLVRHPGAGGRPRSNSDETDRSTSFSRQSRAVRPQNDLFAHPARALADPPRPLGLSIDSTLSSERDLLLASLRDSFDANSSRTAAGTRSRSFSDERSSVSISRRRRSRRGAAGGGALDSRPVSRRRGGARALGPFPRLRRSSSLPRVSSASMASSTSMTKGDRSAPKVESKPRPVYYDPLDDPLVNASIRAAERTRAAARFSSALKARGGALTNLLFSRPSSTVSSANSSRSPSPHVRSKMGKPAATTAASSRGAASASGGGDAKGGGGGMFGAASKKKNKRLAAPSLSFSFDAQTFDPSTDNAKSPSPHLSPQPRSPFGAHVRTNTPLDAAPLTGGVSAGGGGVGGGVSRAKDTKGGFSQRRFAYTDPLSAGERLRRYFSQKLSSGDAPSSLSVSTSVAAASADAMKRLPKFPTKSLKNKSMSPRTLLNNASQTRKYFTDLNELIAERSGARKAIATRSQKASSSMSQRTDKSSTPSSSRSPSPRSSGSRTALRAPPPPSIGTRLSAVRESPAVSISIEPSPAAASPAAKPPPPLPAFSPPSSPPGSTPPPPLPKPKPSSRRTNSALPPHRRSASSLLPTLSRSAPTTSGGGGGTGDTLVGAGAPLRKNSNHMRSSSAMPRTATLVGAGASTSLPVSAPSSPTRALPARPPPPPSSAKSRAIYLAAQHSSRRLLLPPVSAGSPQIGVSLPKPSINAPSPPTASVSPTHEKADSNVDDTPIVVVHAPSPRVATLVSPSYSSRGILEHKDSRKSLEVGAVDNTAPRAPTLPRKPSISPPPPKPRRASLAASQNQSVPPSPATGNDMQVSGTTESRSLPTQADPVPPPPSHAKERSPNDTTTAHQNSSEDTTDESDSRDSHIVEVSPRGHDLPQEYDYATLFHRRSTLKQRNEVRRKHPAFRELFSFFEPASDRSSSGGGSAFEADAEADAEAEESGVGTADGSASIGAEARDTVPLKLRDDADANTVSPEDRAMASAVDFKRASASLSTTSIPPPPRDVEIPPPPKGAPPPETATKIATESDVRVRGGQDGDLQSETPHAIVQKRAGDALNRHKHVDQSNSDTDSGGKEVSSPPLLEHKVVSALKTASSSSSASASPAKRGGSVPLKRTAFADSFQDKLEDSPMLRKVNSTSVPLPPAPTHLAPISPPGGKKAAPTKVPRWRGKSFVSTSDSANGMLGVICQPGDTHVQLVDLIIHCTTYQLCLDLPVLGAYIDACVACRDNERVTQQEVLEIFEALAQRNDSPDVSQALHFLRNSYPDQPAFENVLVFLDGECDAIVFFEQFRKEVPVRPDHAGEIFQIPPDLAVMHPLIPDKPPLAKFLIRKVFNSAAQPGLLALTHRPGMPASLYERLSKHELDAKAHSDYKVKLTNSRSLISEVAAAALASSSTSASSESNRTDTGTGTITDFEGGDHFLFSKWSDASASTVTSASELHQVKQRGKSPKKSSRGRRSRSRPPPSSVKPNGVASETEPAALSMVTVSFEDAHPRSHRRTELVQRKTPQPTENLGHSLSPLSHVTLSTDNFLQTGEDVDASEGNGGNVPRPRRPAAAGPAGEPQEKVAGGATPSARQEGFLSAPSSHMAHNGPPIYYDTDSEAEPERSRGPSNSKGSPGHPNHRRVSTWSRPRATSIGDGGPRPPRSRSPGPLLGAIRGPFDSMSSAGDSDMMSRTWTNSRVHARNEGHHLAKRERTLTNAAMHRTRATATTTSSTGTTSTGAGGFSPPRLPSESTASSTMAFYGSFASVHGSAGISADGGVVTAAALDYRDGLGRQGSIMREVMAHQAAATRSTRVARRGRVSSGPRHLGVKEDHQKRSSSVASSSSRSPASSSAASLKPLEPHHMRASSSPPVALVAGSGAGVAMKTPEFLRREKHRSVAGEDSPIEVIWKCGDDLRQDVACLQIFRLMNQIWARTKLRARGFNVEARVYRCVPIATDMGFVEMVPNCISLTEFDVSHLSKRSRATASPSGGSRSKSPRGSPPKLKPMRGSDEEWEEEQSVARLVTSAAGSYIACFILGIRDRHSDNILIDSLGNLFHIDFGYILGNGVSFDTARFAITRQLKEAMGSMWNLFVMLAVKAFKTLREHQEMITRAVVLMLHPFEEERTIRSFMRSALLLDMTEAEACAEIRRLLSIAPDSYKTKFKNQIHAIAQKI